MKRTSPSSSSKKSNFDQEQYLYLTTRGRTTGQPREIEIWFTHQLGRFYVIAEYPTSHWVENIRAHPEVKIRVAGQEFAAHARFPSAEREKELLTDVQALSQKKYGWSDGLVVEIVPSIS